MMKLSSDVGIEEIFWHPCEEKTAREKTISTVRGMFLTVFTMETWEE
jgi:hypothetical protein